MNNLPIYVIEDKQNNTFPIKLTEGEYEGIIYTYGKVEFKEDESADQATLSFEYDILDMNNKVISDINAFQIYIGKILEELIRKGIEENNISYTGGVDENRTKDSEQFDT